MIKEVMVLGEATNELSNLCVIKGCLLRRDVIALSVVRVPLLVIQAIRGRQKIKKKSQAKMIVAT